MSEILQEIPDEQWPNLRDLFKIKWPLFIHLYYILDNYIDWKKRGLTNIKFFSPNGNWSDGTCIAVEEVSFYSIMLFSLEEKSDRLKNALEKTNLIKWNHNNSPILFSAIHENFHSMVENELKRRNITDVSRDIGKLWWISREDALKYEYKIPSDVYLAPLKLEDVSKIDSVWPHRTENDSTSKNYLSQLITSNGGFGIYLKSDNTLCSWIMRNNYGGLAILQTDEKHTRKGYGTLMIKHFSKYWAEKGLDIFCFIMVHNKPSMTLFQKLGWKKEHGINWYFKK